MNAFNNLDYLNLYHTLYSAAKKNENTLVYQYIKRTH